MEILAIIPIILIAAFILGEMFKRIGLPGVIGQILTGLLFGVPVIKELLFSEGSALVIIDFLLHLEYYFFFFSQDWRLKLTK